MPQYRKWIGLLSVVLPLVFIGSSLAETPSTERDLPAPIFTIISVDLVEVPLETALNHIAEKGGFPLNYNRSRIPIDATITVQLELVRALDALRHVMDETQTALVTMEQGQLVIVPASDVDAVESTISGFIVDHGDGEQLSNATIVVLNGDGQRRLGTLSNAEGYYAIPGITEDFCVIIASYIGYETFRDTLEIANRNNVRVDIELKRTAVQLGEVLVEADLNSSPENNLSVRPSIASLKVRDIKQMAAMGEPDLLRGLQLLPGVQSASDFSSGLYVRGGGPDQTGIFLDQARLYNPSHAFGLFSTFNPDAVKDVTLYKGAYPAQYGGNLGAVLDVQNRDGNRRRFSTSGGISLISSRLLAEGPLGSGSWMLAGRRTYIDPLLRAVRKRADEFKGLGYHFYDVNGKMNTQLTDRDNLMVSFYGGEDDLNLAIQEGDDRLSFGMLWGNQTVTGRWTHVFSPQLFSRLIALYSEYHSRITVDLLDLPLAIDNKVREVTLKSDFDYFASDRHTLRSGADLSFYRFNYGSQFDEYKSTLSTKPFLLNSYIQDDWQLSSLTEAQLGVRAAYYSDGSDLSVNPRFSLRHFLQDNVRIKLAGGIYRQYLQLVSSEGFSGADTWVPLDETVDPGRSWQVITGLEWDASKSYSLSTEAYYTDLSNLVSVNEDAEENREDLTSKELFHTGGTGYATGLEFFLEKRSGQLTGWLGYTLGWTRRTFDQIDYGRSHPPKYDRRHDLSLTATYRFTPACSTCGHWILTTNFVYGTGQAYTPAAARYTLTDPAAEEPVDRLLAARRNSGRLLPYHRLDLGVRRTLTLFGQHAEIYLQIVNAYNRRNEWFIQYDAEDSEKPPQIVRMLPVIPTFGFDFRF